MEAKETNYKEVLKSNIILFLSYSILIGFIFILLAFIVKCALQDISNTFLSITLSLISGILIFNSLHFVSKSSTLESLKKMTLNEENSNKFTKKMNLFFIICILISIVICIGYLVTDSLMFRAAINQAYEKYEFISPEFADKVVKSIHEEYQNSFLSKISSTIIIELSLVISFLSLIPYEKKLLSKYNKV